MSQMSRSRRKTRYYHKRQFYRKYWFLGFILLAVVGSLIFGIIRINQSKSSQTKLQQTSQQHVAKKSALFLQQAKFKSDLFSARGVSIKLTNGKIITDANNQPVLMIEFKIKNKTSSYFEPDEVWRMVTHVSQQNQLLKLTRAINKDTSIHDYQLLAKAKKQLAPGRSVTAAIPFTLKNKATIQIRFRGPKHDQHYIGLKKYHITG
ncbi:DUF5067 domain-containing protein [Agrilactobacillus fermenti]|uniref:DUF5067 domain-containing protein n=1 Tax=Agrilactobacillus fermenti TaxID=2586909 RepID=UPI001E2D3D29|nr:DUF5067 domain-containing protein [Agrilactobacillus fermenti]MCD2256198.1 DUF5067 domain-containing protein [Agrilactobacillus fermenti]